MKPTRKYQVWLLPYLAGNSKGEIEMILPSGMHVVEGVNIFIEYGQFHIKDAHGACVFSAPVDSVRHCKCLGIKKLKKASKVLSICGEIVK